MRETPEIAGTPTEQLHRRTAVRKLFEETRRRLVETGTRNRLVHVNRQSRRSNTLDIINERSDDVYKTNLPLQERLKGDFGIQLSDIDVDDGWTPSRYFDTVADTVARCARWKIDRDGMQLGFFSFSKLLMFRDLDRRTGLKMRLKTTS